MVIGGGLVAIIRKRLFNIRPYEQYEEREDTIIRVYTIYK